MSNSTQAMQILFRDQLRRKMRPLMRLTGTISILSSIILAIGLIAYIVQRRRQNVHSWTQFSLLVSLFLTFFSAGVRRLVYAEGNPSIKLHFFELMEDVGVTSISSHLILLSVDLFYMVWEVLPPKHAWHSFKRFWISIALAWSLGLVVVVLHLVVPPSTTSDPRLQIGRDLALDEVLETVLCIQMYSTNAMLTQWLMWMMLLLFSVNTFLFLAITYFLYKRHRDAVLPKENLNPNKVLKQWVSRLVKLMLLLGLWWPMNIVCIFECLSTFKKIVGVWTSLETATSKPADFAFDLPWHLYAVHNYLAIQSVFVCFILILNRRTVTYITNSCCKDSAPLHS